MIRKFGKTNKGSRETLISHLNTLVDAINTIQRRINGGSSKQNIVYTGWFFAQITDSTLDGDAEDKRWKYDWQQVFKSTAGYEEWEEDLDGKSGSSATSNPAYNIRENLGATGENASECPDDTIVIMFECLNVNGKTEYWFDYDNPLGVGDTEYQVFSMKTVNSELVAGWDFARLH